MIYYPGKIFTVSPKMNAYIQNMPRDKPLFYAGKWREMDHILGFEIDGIWKKLWQL